MIWRGKEKEQGDRERERERERERGGGGGKEIRNSYLEANLSKTIQAITRTLVIKD